ncbi:DNA polymerase lambda [Hypsibius exemplaris]|uniref:DNA polymerase n=1 Tax=Hypsibius exemplaris TaxID=2072580 RepID=A0A1W0WLA6_HYPEX|nr:DNA polymerase lambda [Hypsibius exemplaris]
MKKAKLHNGGNIPKSSTGSRSDPRLSNPGKCVGVSKLPEISCTKPKIPSGNSTTASPSGDNFFLRGVIISIIPERVPKARVDLLRKRIGERGGGIVTFHPQGALDETVTHYVVDDSVDAEEALRVFLMKQPDLEALSETLSNVQCLPCKWISGSLMSRTRLDEGGFFLHRQLLDLITRKMTASRKLDCTPPKSAFALFSLAVLATPFACTPKSEPSSMLSVNAGTGGDGSGIKRKWESIAEHASSGYEDSGGAESSDSDEEDSDVDEEFLARVQPGHMPFAAKFVCSYPSSSGRKNVNGHITDQLEKLQNTYKSTGQDFRAMAYGKAIGTVRNAPRITKIEDIKGLRGIGSGIKSKIIEILETGACEKVAAYCMDNEMNKAIELFCGIHGVSSKTALKWASSNLRTLEELPEKVRLNRVQQIGLKHYHDFLERIPRSEVVEIESTVKEAALRLQDGLELITCGSYRRGKPTCGDVDILVTHPDGKSHRNIFAPLLDSLRSSGFITDDLLVADEGSQKKFLGVCLLPNPGAKHRRLDIIVVPYSEFGCALLYFTGSAHFNRSMRSLAHKANMALSHHSLNKNAVRVGKKKVSDGEPLPGMITEKAIFDYLGLKYLEPADRDH